MEALYSKMGVCCLLIWECLLLVLYIAFLPIYVSFRSRAFLLDDTYPLYTNWLWNICIILTVIMVLFPGLILCLLWTLNCYGQVSSLPPTSMELSTKDSEQNSSKSDDSQENYDVNCKILETCESKIFSQHQESCEDDTASTLFIS